MQRKRWQWTWAVALAVLGAAAAVPAPAAAEPTEQAAEPNADLVEARLAPKMKALQAAAREHKVEKVLVVVRAGADSDADRPRVLDVVRAAAVAAANDLGLAPETAAEADAAFARPEPGGKAPPDPQPSDVKRLLEDAPSCDAVLAVLYSRKVDKRGVRMVLLNAERSLGTASVTLARADLADLLTAPLTHEDVDRAARRIAAAVEVAIEPLPGVLDDAGLKHVAVVVVPGRGDSRQNEALAATVAAGLERSLAAAGTGGAGAATRFDVSRATRVRFERGRKPGPLSPKDVKRLQAAGKGDGEAGPAGEAFDGILGVVCGRQGRRASVEFTLVDANGSLWKASAPLDVWDVAEIPAMPLLNQAVVAFANARMGEQVGDGECWTLAAEALKSARAKPAAGYTFGRELDPTELPMPGDVIQFETVRLGGLTLGLPNHTAVINRVLGPQRYELLHQNMFGSKLVRADTFDFSTMESGRIQIFRPVPS
jgi:hypothetical protein